MINEKDNTQVAQSLADSSKKPVAIYCNSRGAVNIQFMSDTPLDCFPELAKVVTPTTDGLNCFSMTPDFCKQFADCNDCPVVYLKVRDIMDAYHEREGLHA